MMVTAVRYPPETNELVEARLNELPGLKVNVNRVAECKLHFECEVEWIKEAGNHFVVLGKVVSVSGSKAVLTVFFTPACSKINSEPFISIDWTQPLMSAGASTAYQRVLALVRLASFVA